MLHGEKAHGEKAHGVEERRFACWGSFGPPVVSAICPRGSSIQVMRAGLKVNQKQQQHKSKNENEDTAAAAAAANDDDDDDGRYSNNVQMDANFNVFIL